MSLKVREMEGASAEPGTWALPEDYERLLKIEKFVLVAVEISRQVCEELSRKTDHDNNKLLHLCSTFSENIESAQNLIVEATKKHQHHRHYTGDSYQELNQSQVFIEKLNAMQVCVSQMEQYLTPQ